MGNRVDTYCYFSYTIPYLLIIVCLIPQPSLMNCVPGLQLSTLPICGNYLAVPASIALWIPPVPRIVLGMGSNPGMREEEGWVEEKHS